MKLTVLGTGYVGLVAGTCFAESGNDVVCVDVDAEKVARLSRGEVPIYEPGLEELIERNVADGRLSFTTDPGAVAGRDAVFVAVQTPQDEDGSADLQHVLAAARQVANRADRGTLLVLKSTVPVGTARQVKEIVGERLVVVSNPEFLKEGAAIEDFMKPDRVVVGTSDPRARDLMAELYAPFVRTGSPILFMDNESAELTKYAANALLAARISFMNDIARLCDAVGADVDRVRQGVGADRRIGYPFLFPGVGFGGSCFPKDVQALLHTAGHHGVDFGILEATLRTNEAMKRRLVERAQTHFGSLAGRRFAVWGLSFKPNTDDIREAPSLVIVRRLVEAGATVRVNCPAALDNARRALSDLEGSVEYCGRNYDCLEGVDGLFLVTEWNEYRRPDFDRMKALMKEPVLFDGRNIWDPARMRERGFVYYGIGRR